MTTMNDSHSMSSSLDLQETGSCKRSHIWEKYSISITENDHHDKSTRAFIDSQELLLDLCSALLAYGMASHRLEPLAQSLGDALGVSVQVYYLPTCILLQFSRPLLPGQREHHIIKSRGGWDFGKLQPLHSVCKEIVRGRLSAEAAADSLETIKRRTSEWSELWIAAGYPLSAATSAIMFFHGTGWDALASGVLACVPAGMRLLANRFPSLWWTYEIICCAIVSIIAAALSSRCCYSTLLLSSVVTLLPGYTVTASVVEIMTKNVISGAVRLCYTVVYLAGMAYGLTLPVILYNRTVGNGFNRKPLNAEAACPAEQTIAVNHLWLIACVPLYIFSYNIYLKAPWRQWIVMTLVGTIGYAVGYLCKRVWESPPEVNAFMAAFAIGLSANAYSRWSDDLSFNAIVAGVFIQVPGSWGLRGMLALAYQDYDRALYWNYSMLAICVGISGALLLTNCFIWGPRLMNRGVPLTDF
ncbi:hypothetical protein BC832DRAFT_566171 [Gaertneriomyces semiglobifer]|nr:hypothetical protein BC832DRAFT_566171 [Gaertneriomyces semiglobifer]